MRTFHYLFILFSVIYVVNCDVIAAVVEFAPVVFQGNATLQEAQATMLQNLASYEVNFS
jgi:hypothetical protein